MKSKYKEVTFTKPIITKEEEITGTNEIQVTLISKVEIPVTMFHRIPNNLSDKDKNGMQPMLEQMHIQNVENAIDKMLNQIKV